jgi:hypothetical protein
LGTLGWRAVDFSDQQVLDALANQVRLAGYSGDFPTKHFRQFGEEGQTAGVHAGCSIEGLAGDLDASPNIAPNSLVHDCDTAGGSSGSSIIALFDDGNYYIVGLNANEFGVSPNSQIFDPQEECRISRPINGERTTIEAGVPCRNGAVQVSRWATQAAETRAES